MTNGRTGTRILLLIVMTVVVWTGAVVPATAKTIMGRIEVQPASKVDPQHIYLGEIARINSDDKDLKQRLARIVIGSAPPPGERRDLSRSTILLRLRQNGLDPETLALASPETFSVIRNAVEISRAEIEKLVEKAVWRRIPWDKTRVHIVENRASQAVRLPRGKLTYAVNFPPGTSFLGSVPVNVVFKVDHKDVSRVWTRVRIEVMGDLVVTTRPVARYQVITAEDVTIQTIAMSGASADAITEPGEVIGKRCRRTLAAGTPLRSDMVEMPPLVKRGDIVTVVAETRGLRILTRGEVRRKGHLGQRIPVLNLDSNRNIYAHVIDPKTVRVEF